MKKNCQAILEKYFYKNIMTAKDKPIGQNHAISFYGSLLIVIIITARRTRSLH